MSSSKQIRGALRGLVLSFLALHAGAALAANTATITPSATSYSASGGTVTFTVSLGYTSALAALDLRVVTPAQWKYVATGGANVPQTAPSADDLGSFGFDFIYSAIPATSPATFTFTVSYPAGMTGDKNLTGIQANFTDEATSVVSSVSVPNLTLTPAPTPPSITTHPANQTVVAGGTASFTVVAVGNPAPGSFAWQRSTDGTTFVPVTDGAGFSGSATSTLTITGAAVALDGNRFRVVVGNGVPGDATSNSALLTVGRASQTITFGPLAAKTFGDPSFTLSASASSGLAVSYASSNLAVATVSGNTVTIVGAGSTTLTASQSGNADFGAAADVPQTLVVSKAAATLTLSPATAVYDGSPKPVTATTTPPGLPASITYSGEPTPPTNAGSYDVAASINHANYTGIAAPFTLVIGKAAQTITFAPIGQREFSVGSLTLAATASSGLPVAYTSSNPAVATVSGSTVTFVAVGETTITAKQAGGANHSAAVDVPQTLTVVPAIQTITFPAIASQTFAPGATVALTATASSGLAVNYESLNPDVATVSGSSATIVKAGTAVIRATQPGNASFGAAVPVNQSLVVTKATATVTLASLAHIYNGSARSATATTVPAGLDVAITYAGTAGATTAPVNAGTYGVTATIVSDSYQGTDTRDLVVAKADQVITFAAPPSRTFGEAGVTVTATASSGLPVVFESLVPAVATVTPGGAVTLLTGGTAVLRATQPGDGNFHAAAPVVRDLVVAKAPATVALTNLAHVYSGASKAAGAVTNPAGLTVALAYTGTSSATTAPTNAGSYGVTATIVDSRYEGTPDAGTLVIAKAEQTITFAALESRSIDQGGFTLTASASSGLPVTYATSNPSSGTVATIAGNAVTLANVGTLTITASQAGDANHLAAAPVERTLTVLNQSQTIAFDAAQLPGKTFGDAPFSISATSNRGLLVGFESSDPTVATVAPSTLVGTNSTAVVTILGAGSVTLTAKQPGDTNSAAAPDVPRVLTVGKASQTIAFAALPGRTFNDPPFTLAATASSGLATTFSVVSGPATISGNTLTMTAAGSITVRASQAGGANHLAAPDVERTFTVAKADQTIAFAPLADRAVTSPPFTLEATASSGLVVGFTSSNPAAATVSGNVVTIVGAGTTTITAAQAGSASYNAAAPVARTLSVVAVPTVGFPAPGNVRTAAVGTPVSVQLTANPAATAFAFTGLLPPGLALSAGGLVSGTPTTQGTFTAQVTASNVAGSGPSAPLVFMVSPGPNAPVITSPPLVQGQVGQPLTYALASSPAGATTYALTSGALPGGVSFNPATGAVTGTPAAGAAGSYAVYFSGSNASGTGQAMEVTFIIAPAAGVPVVISNGTASGVVAQPFSYQIAGTNSPTSFAAAGLPAGLTLNTTTGVISGIPSAATGSSPATVLLTAANAVGASAAKPLLLTIAPAAATPVITSGAVMNGRVGAAFAYQITASESPTSFVATGLPPGLTLNATSGLISGTPSQPGSAAVSIAAANASGLGAAAALHLTIAAAATAPAISSPATATGQVGQTDEFRYQIITTGGAATSYALTGTLPPGLSFNSASGLISGRPLAPGVAIVSLTATGDGGTSQPQALTLTVNPAAGVPIITSETVRHATAGAAFTYAITATNLPPTTPYPPGTTLDAVNLPAGLAVNPATGVIQGVPAAIGSTTASLFGTNAAGVGPTRDLVINVQAAPAAPVVAGPALASAQVGVSFTYQITASASPTSFEMLGAPSWLSVNNATGLASGTPTLPGLVTVQLTAANSAGASNPAPLTINVAPAPGTPVITSSQTAAATVGAAFSYQVTATPAATSFLATGLPTGVSFNPATGAVSGTPALSGTFTVRLSGTNAAGVGAAVELVLTVQPSASLVLPGS